MLQYFGWHFLVHTHTALAIGRVSRSLVRMTLLVNGYPHIRQRAATSQFDTRSFRHYRAKLCVWWATSRQQFGRQSDHDMLT